MALGAMFIVGVLIFLLPSRQNLFTPTFVLRTYLDDSSGMTEGAPVRLNGILVGELDQLKLTDSKDPRRIVEIVMNVRRQYLNDIPKDSRAGISASNLLGDKFINISNETPPQHVHPRDELT